MKGSEIKMAKSVKAVLSAIALLTANAAWCQSHSPYAASRGGNQLEAIPISKVKIRDAVIAGFRIAFAREIVWPRYAYEISPYSDDLVNTCQLLEQIDQDVAILTSEFNLDEQNSSGEVKGYLLEPSRVCEFKNMRSNRIVWPRYAYEINPYSGELFGICQYIDRDRTLRMIDFNLYAQTSSGDVKSEELELGRVCDSNVNSQEIYNYLSSSFIDYDNYYLVTEKPMPSLKFGNQTLEFDTLIWPDNAGKLGIYNYLLSSFNDYDNYYLVTERPIPSLNLNSRVWLGDEPSYSVAILNWMTR